MIAWQEKPKLPTSCFCTFLSTPNTRRGGFLGIPLQSQSNLDTKIYSKNFGFGAFCEFIECYNPSLTGKKSQSRYFKRIPLKDGAEVAELYHYKGWELVVSRNHRLYARRVFQHDEDENYVFLWQILSVICYSVQHWFLYTGGKL